VKGFKTPLVAFSVSALAALVLSLIVKPLDIYRAVITSPLGMVLIGRTMMAYTLVYPATGSEYLALASAILFNNSMSLMAVLFAPLAIHAAYTYGLRFRKKTVLTRVLLLNPGWRFCQHTIAGLSMFYAAFLGLAVVTMLILEGPKIFMPLEAAYVLAAAATVYKASREDADNIVPYYRRAVKKVLPPILILLVTSALVEAYEII
jgi:uncharacterized membrane protein